MGASDLNSSQPGQNDEPARLSNELEGKFLPMESPVRAIGIRDWDALEDRMFRSEWIGGALILLFLLLVTLGLLQGA